MATGKFVILSGGELIGYRHAAGLPRTIDQPVIEAEGLRAADSQGMPAASASCVLTGSSVLALA